MRIRNQLEHTWNEQGICTVCGEDREWFDRPWDDDEEAEQ